MSLIYRQKSILKLNLLPILFNINIPLKMKKILPLVLLLVLLVFVYFYFGGQKQKQKQNTITSIQQEEKPVAIEPKATKELSKEKKERATSSLPEQIEKTNIVPQSKPENKITEQALPANDNHVPDTIPLEMAERYFIPREQRGPGNIGGPPPLPFVPGTGSGGTVDVTPPSPSLPTNLE